MKNENNKKILILTSFFYPEQNTSAILPSELAFEFAKEAYDITALVGYPKEYVKAGTVVPKKETVNGVKISRLKYTGFNRHSVLGRIANILSFSLAVFFKPSYFRKADVVITITNPPLLPYIVALHCRFFHKKLITYIFDLYPDVAVNLGYLSATSKIAKVFNVFYKTVFKVSDKVVAISGDMKEYLHATKSLPYEKLQVIHNWYNDIKPDSTYIVPATPSKENPLTIIYGGNMGEAQDMDTLLEAVKILKNDERFKFILVGQGSQKEKIKDYIVENQLSNCLLHDYVPKDEYDKMSEAASLGVLSLKSVIKGLGSPSKLYSYLATKKPVIAILPEGMDIGEAITSHNVGLVVANGESQKIADFLKGCAEDTNKLNEMAENGYKLFKDNYTLEKSFEKYKALVEEI